MIREIEVAGNKLIIHELEDVCDSVTGKALTGSWVWDSAIVFSEWLATQAQLGFIFQGKTVLELGAGPAGGTGIPGLTAARLGASRVILTDIEPLLPGLKGNVEANGLGSRVDVSQLVWGSDKLPSQLGELGGGVDMVLMSDVFYDIAEMAGLAHTMKRVCRGGSTHVFAACEVRPWTSDCLHELVNEGFAVVELASQLKPELSSMLKTASMDVFAVFQLIPPNDDKDQLWDACNI